MRLRLQLCVISLVAEFDNRKLQLLLWISKLPSHLCCDFSCESCQPRIIWARYVFKTYIFLIVKRLNIQLFLCSLLVADARLTDDVLILVVADVRTDKVS